MQKICLITSPLWPFFTLHLNELEICIQMRQYFNV